MSYGRAQLHDSEDELPESDDELIMSVLLDLGIQERPDIDNRNDKELEITTSTRSSYTVVDESPPRRFSVAFLEKPDGCTVAFKDLTDEQDLKATEGKQQLNDHVNLLRQELYRLRDEVLQERQQEREQIKKLEEKLDASQGITTSNLYRHWKKISANTVYQKARVERWQSSYRQMRRENKRLLVVRSGLERQSKWVKSQIDSLLYEDIEPFDAPNEVDPDTSSSPPAEAASSSFSSAMTSLAPSFLRRKK